MHEAPLTRRCSRNPSVLRHAALGSRSSDSDGKGGDFRSGGTPRLGVHHFLCRTVSVSHCNQSPRSAPQQRGRLWILKCDELDVMSRMDFTSSPDVEGD